MHAVGAEQEAVVQRHRLGRVVEPGIGLDAQRAGQQGAIALADMVDGQTGQAVATQAVGAGVADVKDVGVAATQDERGEGAAHAGQRRVLTALGVEPGVQGIDDAGGGAADFHRLGNLAKTVEKETDGGLGGDATAPGAADAVGDDGGDVAAFGRRGSAEHTADEILVAFPRPGLGGEADADERDRALAAHGMGQRFRSQRSWRK